MAIEPTEVERTQGAKLDHGHVPNSLDDLARFNGAPKRTNARQTVDKRLGQKLEPTLRRKTWQPCPSRRSDESRLVAVEVRCFRSFRGCAHAFPGASLAPPQWFGCWRWLLPPTISLPLSVRPQ